MVEMDTQQFRQLQKQIREAKVGGTNGATLQLLANMCREEEMIMDYKAYQTKRDEQQEDRQTATESFWRRRLMRGASVRKIETEATNKTIPEQDNKNLFGTYVKRKCEKQSGHGCADEKATFSENIQDLLFKMTSKFGSNINDAYKSDPATAPSGVEASQSMAATLQQVAQIDQNMAAIDQDMKVLDAKNGDFRQAMQEMAGLTHLGADDYLEDDESDSDDEDESSGSEDDGSEDDDDDSDEEGSWDSDDSDDSSIDSAFMDGIADAIGISMPEEDDDSVDTTYVKAVASGKIAPSTLPRKINQPLSATSSSTVSITPSGNSKVDAEEMDNENEGSDDEETDSEDEDSDGSYDSEDDSSLDEEYLSSFAKTLEQKPQPSNPTSQAMAELAKAAIPLVTKQQMENSGGQVKTSPSPEATSTNSNTNTSTVPLSKPSTNRFVVPLGFDKTHGFGFNVGSFDSRGKPNAKASRFRRSLLACSSNEGDCMTSDLGIAARIMSDEDNCDSPYDLSDLPSGDEEEEAHNEIMTKKRISRRHSVEGRIMESAEESFNDPTLVSFNDFCNLMTTFDVMKENFEASVGSSISQPVLQGTTQAYGGDKNSSDKEGSKQDLDALGSSINLPATEVTMQGCDGDNNLSQGSVLVEWDTKEDLVVSWGDTGSDSDADDESEKAPAIVSSWNPRRMSNETAGSSEEDEFVLTGICEMNAMSGEAASVKSKKSVKKWARRRAEKRESWEANRASFSHAFQNAAAAVQSEDVQQQSGVVGGEEVKVIFPTFNFQSSKKKKSRRKKDDDTLSTRRRRKIRQQTAKTELKNETDYYKGLEMLDKAQARTLVKASINARI